MYGLNPNVKKGVPVCTLKIDGREASFHRGSPRKTFISVVEQPELDGKFIDKYPKNVRGVDTEIIPCIDPDDRDMIYCAGKSGSGKSTWVGNYIKQYKKLFPGNKVILFSLKDSDKALDKYSPIRIALNEELFENPIELDELDNSLVIFDDVDSMDEKLSKRSKMIKMALMNLKDMILQVGRSHKIYVAITSHNVTDYLKSRIVLQEASLMTLFPHSGSAKQLKYCLKNYAGLEDEQINRIKNLASRWVTIRLTAPIVVIHEKGCYIP